VAGLMALTALPAAGQQPPSRGPVRGGPNPLTMIRHKAALEELKLTKEQTEKLKDFMTEWRDKMLALVENGQRDKLPGVLKEQQEKLFKILTPEQVKRLKQVTLQVHGLWAMTTPEAAKELRLTDDQTKKLRALQSETEKQMNKLFEGGATTRTEAQKKVAELHAAANEKGLQVLTEEQRARWKGLLGEPFKGKIERNPPGGFRDRR
jgi:Spy/CpxP family protein refolding chaperone